MLPAAAPTGESVCSYCGNVSRFPRAKLDDAARVQLLGLAHGQLVESARQQLVTFAQEQMVEATREVEAHSADLAHRKLAAAARQKELEVEERRGRLFVLGMSGLFFVGSLVVLVIGLRTGDGKSVLGGGVGATLCGSLLLALVLQRRR